MNDNYNNLRKVIESRKQLQSDREVDNRCKSKQFLSDRIRKDLMTTAIGNIALIENEFGTLWGYGKAYNELTENEKVWRNIWEEMRNSILDSVNARIRNAQNELVKFDILHVGYFYSSKG